MAGHGDLLDSVWEAASERNIELERLDGIEIDNRTAAVCRERLGSLSKHGSPLTRISSSSAFDPEAINALPLPQYDLVITNPPYVRYQSLGGGGNDRASVRAGLKAIVAGPRANPESRVWGTVVNGYSGLSDLSVPAWILAAAMVRPEGRLALVVPATWRNRDYGDIIRYLLLRCFALDCIVADRQPGWFSDALVRTHLVVARRLAASGGPQQPNPSATSSGAPWIEVTPEAATTGSLVGSAFPCARPEAAFASWLRAGCRDERRGIAVRRLNVDREWAELRRRAHPRRWYRLLEGRTEHPRLFSVISSTIPPPVPTALAPLLPDELPHNTLVSLADAGIAVGQGLRTGCNSFFYVTAREAVGPQVMTVQMSALFSSLRISVPVSVLRPVLRRQSELRVLEAGRVPDGRVLDLRSWVLPEDLPAVLNARSIYLAKGESLPEPMPRGLVDYVRLAATTTAAGGKLIPMLSAVRSNVRTPGGSATPRFWYMLPDFARRHFPAAFVPRVNHDVPRAIANRDPMLCVDANFSTFWAPAGSWTRHALAALLNSAWCRAVMEALGTPMGGGALKLEATQLRRMLVPVFSDADKEGLDAAGKQLRGRFPARLVAADEIVLRAMCAGMSSVPSLVDLAEALHKCGASLAAARQRASR